MTKRAKLLQFIQNRLIGDLIKVSNIFCYLDNININHVVSTDLTNTIRNNGFKIIGKRFKSNRGKHFSIIES